MQYLAVAAAAAALLTLMAPVAASRQDAQSARQNAPSKNAISTELRQTISEPDVWTITHERGLIGSINQGGALKIDINRDGIDELVGLSYTYISGVQHLSVMQWQAEKAELRLVRQSETIEGPLHSVFRDEHGRALAITGSESLSLVDLDTMKIVAKREGFATTSGSITFSDFNDSGSGSLLVSVRNAIHVLSTADLSTKSIVASGRHNEIGSFVASGKLSTLAYETDYSTPYPHKCRINALQHDAGTWVPKSTITLDGTCSLGDGHWRTDINSDGVHEYLWRFSDGSRHKVALLDFKSASVRWTQELSSFDTKFAGEVDWNADGGNDLLLITPWSRSVVGIDGKTGSVLSVPVPADRVQDWFVAFDVNGDGMRDMMGPRTVGGSGVQWTGIDIVDGRRVWDSTDAGSAFTALALARDESGDTLFSLSGESHDNPGTGRFLSALSTGDLSDKWRIELFPFDNNRNVAYAVFAHDNDGDGRDEVNVIARKDNQLVLFVVDIRTGRYLTQILRPNTPNGLVFKLHDLNGDQRADLVISDGNGILVRDLRSGETLAANEDNPDLRWVFNFASVDRDRDGKTELYANAHADGQRRILRLGRRNADLVIEQTLEASPYQTQQLLNFDVDADGHEELLAANQSGDLLVLNSDGVGWTKLLTACASIPATISAVSSNELLVICGTQSVLYDAETRASTWIAKQLSSYVFSQHSVATFGDEGGRSIYLGGSKLSRLAWVGEVRKPIALPLQLSTHWRTASSVDLPVQNPNPSLTLTATVSVNPGKGSAAVEGTRLTYTPSGNSLDADTLYYTVSNGYLNSDPAKVDIVRTNTTPVAGAGSSLSVTAGQSVSGSVQAVDADSDPLSYRVTTAATKGTFTVNANGSFSYQANASSTGSDAVTLVASDGIADSQPISISFSITAPAKSGGGGGGGAAAAIGLLLVLVALRRKRAH